mmetsp:Transcript_55774/g.127610  ORF Transcript_55774/g.127610 Transcript_55774/m.127610 type:complete len:214 (+) Transcript_55774:795-1436(+)
MLRSTPGRISWTGVWPSGNRRTYPSTLKVSVPERTERKLTRIMQTLKKLLRCHWLRALNFSQCTACQAARRRRRKAVFSPTSLTTMSALIAPVTLSIIPSTSRSTSRALITTHASSTGGSQTLAKMTRAISETTSRMLPPCVSNTSSVRGCSMIQPEMYFCFNDLSILIHGFRFLACLRRSLRFFFWALRHSKQNSSGSLMWCVLLSVITFEF